MKNIFKKIITVLAVGGTFAGYVFSQKNISSQPFETLATTSTQAPAPTSVVVAVNTPKPVSKSTSTPVPKPVVASKLAPKPVGAFVDGTYTGNIANAFYGNIQVQAVIRNGVLADVIFLQHPSDRNRSIQINNMAMPRLKSEAIQTQSANVNTISGASASSQAFSQSLQSALNQAKA